MADDQAAQNEEGDGQDYGGDDDDGETSTLPIVEETTTVPPALEPQPQPQPQPESEANFPGEVVPGADVPPGGSEDYFDDEDLPPVTVNLYINELPEGQTLPPTDLVNAGLLDAYGNPVTPSTTVWTDLINDYTTAITQEVTDQISGTGIDKGGKSWWGTWSWNKILFIGLIALCIIGILLAVLFLILGKKFKKDKRTGAKGTTVTTKSVVTKGISPGTRYEPV